MTLFLIVLLVVLLMNAALLLGVLLGGRPVTRSCGGGGQCALCTGKSKTRVVKHDKH